MAAADELSQTYYPSCVVSMLIRFDEALQAQWASGAFINTPPATGSTTARLNSSAALANAGEPGTAGIARMPKSANIELPGIRKPGTFNLTFDYRDLPIDPRLVRSVGIEIYLDSVKASDFATGVVEQSSERGRASVIEPWRRISAVTPTPKNLVLKGLVDSWHVNHTSSGSIATLEGRDLTGLFLDTPLTPTLVQSIRLDQPIDVVIRNIVTQIGGWNQHLEVIAADATQWPGGSVPYLANDSRLNLAELDAAKAASKHKQKQQPRPRRSAKFNSKPRRSTGADPDKLSFWDLVTRYCFLVGAVPTYSVVKGGAGFRVALQILPQWGLYDYMGSDTVQGLAPSPFNPVRPDVGKVRRLMYGRNVEELSFERKYQGITARAVEVVSYDPSSKARNSQRLLSATSTLRPSYAEMQGVSPPLATIALPASRSSVSPSGLTSYDAVMRIPVKGVTDPVQLQRLADGLYEEIMRGETGGNIRTKSLASFGGKNEDPDLLYLRPRDPIQIAVDIRELGARAPNVSTPLTNETRQTDAALVEEITKRTGNKVLAQAIVASSRSAAFQPQNYFRVNAVRFDWDIKSGVSIAMDFHNYIMARDAIHPPPPAASNAPVAGARTGGGTQTKARK